MKKLAHLSIFLLASFFALNSYGMGKEPHIDPNELHGEVPFEIEKPRENKNLSFQQWNGRRFEPIKKTKKPTSLKEISSEK